MCCCGKPNVNGEPGYSWDGKASGVHPVNAPVPAGTDTILYDEPGRCGGLDSHSFHFRVVRAQWGGFSLLVRHGGGDERVELGSRPGVGYLAALDSTGRYWMLQALYHVQEGAARRAHDAEASRWRQAAAEKRIKTRRARGSCRVWIVEKEAQAA